MARDGTNRRGRQRREVAAMTQLPRRALRNPYAPIEVVSADEIEAIHNTSMQVLEEIGMDFLHPEAREILGRAGAEVEAGTQRVRFDRGLIEVGRLGPSLHRSADRRNPHFQRDDAPSPPFSGSQCFG